MPSSWVVLAQSASWPCRNSSAACGVPAPFGSSSKPSFGARSRTCASRVASSIAPLSFLMMSAGVPVGRHHHEPAGKIEARQCLGGGRHVGRRDQPARRGGRDRAQRATAHMRLHDRGREHAGLRPARDRVLQAVVDVDRRDQHELRAGALVERLRGDAGEIARRRRPTSRSSRVPPCRARSAPAASSPATSGCTTMT